MAKKNPMIEISEIKFIKRAGTKGFIGFLSFVVDEGLYCGGIAVLQREDEFIFRFPLKIGNNNEEYFFYRPINKETMEYIKKICVPFIKDQLANWEEYYKIEE